MLFIDGYILKPMRKAREIEQKKGNVVDRSNTQQNASISNNTNMPQSNSSKS